MRFHVIPAKGMVALGLMFLLGLTGACSEADGTSVKAPDFTLEDLSGKSVSLEDYRGKVVLVDFWATWCPPCRLSIPELVRLQESYAGQGLVILGISLDDPGQADNAFLQAFKEKFRMNYPVLRGNQRVARDYFGEERMGIPTMFVVNREGRIVDRHVGFKPGVLEKAVQKIL